MLRASLTESQIAYNYTKTTAEVCMRNRTGKVFQALFKNRMSGNGLYILDEPESALSVASQMQILVKMKELVDKKSQFIIATHSPILLSYPGTDIYVITDRGLSQIKYEETEQYRLTKYFISNYQKVIGCLMQP